MRFVIVTGVSGAGKTAALKMLEDANYFCVDNLPIPLLEKFASLMPEIHGEDVQNVALGIDARSGRSLDELEAVLDRMKKAGYLIVLFLAHRHFPQLTLHMQCSVDVIYIRIFYSDYLAST